MSSNGFQRILVTAALPYANGHIHLGHLAGAYLPADIYVRYQRLQKRDVLFICGSDEHGVPIMITANQDKITPKEVVDRYHTVNRDVFLRFGMSFDNYSRTSLPIHHQTAQEFFLKLYESGVLIQKSEKQLYDKKAQMFLPDRYVEGTCPQCGYSEAKGDQCEKCGTYLSPTDLKDPKSTITGETPTVQETTHWYFPLGRYQERLENYIAERNERSRWRENVLRYCKSWFKEGLRDRAVTRDLTWGVQVPISGYEKKVLYVWFEAVLGYISSTKEWAIQQGRREEWQDYWLNDGTRYVPFIGKDNIVFHCIFFPAMLMAWNDASDHHYIYPENVPANEFLNYEGQKFSKSRGWGIDLKDYLQMFPPDPLRYTLAVNLPETRDTEFYWKDFQARNNNELADIVGNFVNRTLTFAERNFGNKLPPRHGLQKIDEEMVRAISETPRRVGECFDEFRFRDGVQEVMNLARAGNKYFNDSEPWKSLKEERTRCETALNICIQTIRSLAILLNPVLPFSTERIWTMLGLDGRVTDQPWKSAGLLAVPVGHQLGRTEILFTKIDSETITAKLSRLQRVEDNQSKEPVSPMKPIITLEDFSKVDLRVAKVLRCEKVPRSEKLLKLLVDVGGEQREIVAGIAQQYNSQDLIGKAIVVVVNLKPAKLMGHESRGMLLAATGRDGKLAVLTVTEDIESGSVVK
ncbi:MAG: methionine--tRNA ligase [Bacteroidota bacterium]